MTYAVDSILNPRSFIHSSNSDALVLQSLTNDTRLTFLNSTANQYNLDPRFILSASNEEFLLLYNSNLIAKFSRPSGESQFSVPGRILADHIEIPNNAASRKSVILRDYNKDSEHQYAGFGYKDAHSVYQTPTEAALHAFYAGMDSISSLELMRIQTNQQGSAQVGIGTTLLTSDLALRVGGDTKIDGSLTVQGELIFDKSEFLRLDPETNRLASNVLPQKILYLDETNKVDPTYLHQNYQFQYLRGQKNVGIGTKNPQQRFHVEGTTYMSERLGIGTYSPKARLHLREAAASIPTLILENSTNGNIFEAWRGASNAMTIFGTHNAVGVGTNVISRSNAFEVHGGNAQIHGTMITSNMTIHGFASMEKIHVADANDVYLTQEDLVQSDSTIKRTTLSYTPFQFRDGLSTTTISSIGSTPFVHFKSCGVRVDGDMILGRQMYVMSDARMKTNVTPIHNSLQRIERLHGYTYNLPDGKAQAGLLAQEVIDVLPEAVTLLPSSDYYAVSYDSIVPLLVEAVRDLSKQVRELKRGVINRR